jgi:hypothetical protein
MGIHYLIIGFVVLVIITIQIYSFKATLEKMKIYSLIFSEVNPEYKSQRVPEKNFDTVSQEYKITYKSNGIYEIYSHHTNSIYKKIETALNMYLVNNQKSTSDFSILRDIVERNCISYEHSINVLMSVPLYLGLVGTMMGVSIGVFFLISSGDLTTLLSSNDSSQGGSGITALLSGVGLAMVASICGLILTTINSLYFKKYQSLEENGESEYLTWLQAAVLPKLNDNIAAVLNKTADQLGSFNDTFAHNVRDLYGVFNKVADVSKEQAKAMQAVNEMDFMRLGNAMSQFVACGPQFEKLNNVLKQVDPIEKKMLDTYKDFSDSVEKNTSNLKNALSNQDNQVKNSAKDIYDSVNSQLKELSNCFIESIKSLTSNVNLINERNKELNKLSSAMPDLSCKIQDLNTSIIQLKNLIKESKGIHSSDSNNVKIFVPNKSSSLLDRLFGK